MPRRVIIISLQGCYGVISSRKVPFFRISEAAQTNVVLIPEHFFILTHLLNTSIECHMQIYTYKYIHTNIYFN